jgi:sulfotransferase family protein
MTEITWIASYPKSGNTWLRFMLACYLTKEPVNSVKVGPLNSLIPVIGGGSNSSDSLPEDHEGPLLVKTHSLPGAKALAPYRPATRKAVYLVRNPRDIILSLTNARGARNVNPEDLARDFLANRGMPLSDTEYEWGSWPQNVHDWTTPEVVNESFPGIEVLTVKYENMRADPRTVFRQILEFIDLGQPVDQQYVDMAVESSDLDNMHQLWDKEQPFSQDGTRIKKFRAGQGLTNQSLAALSTDIEEGYQKLFSADDEFALAARKFGYTG